MHETRVGSLGQEDPLQKERATHSGILAWEIVRIEELCLEGYSPWGNKKLDTTEKVTLSTCTSALCTSTSSNTTFNMYKCFMPASYVVTQNIKLHVQRSGFFKSYHFAASSRIADKMAFFFKLQLC